jgi:hypothetical protein
MSFSVTTSNTFSIIHARKLSSKVAADMHLCAQYYGHPSEAQIRQYAEELAQHLNEGYVEEYEFGYEKNGKRVVTWRYKVDENGVLTTDERPGNVVPSVDVSGATFFNYMSRNSRFFGLTGAQRSAFESSMPFRRRTCDPPSDGAGYWTSDRNYYAGGRGLSRQTFQPAV